MRTRASGSPSWLRAEARETGYVCADHAGPLQKPSCKRGGPYVFACDGVAGEEAADRAVADNKAIVRKRAAQFFDRNVGRRLQSGKDQVLGGVDPARLAIPANRSCAGLALLA